MSDKYVDLTLTDGQNDFNIEKIMSENQNVVLLGVPGSGKSVLLQHFYEKHKNECELVLVKQFVKMPVRIKDGAKYFLLDGFDELRCASTEKESKIYDVVAKLIEVEKKCHTLISCREMDWYGDNDDRALENNLSYPVKKVYIAPLSYEQKIDFADQYLDDVDKATSFKSKILNNREYQEILNVPQTLVMLLDLFRVHPDSVPTRKIELYEKIVKLSLEKKKTNLLEGVYNLSENEVFKYAGYIAFFYMISDFDEIENDKLLQISNNPDYKFECLKSVVELNIFENKGHKDFTHRTIAEYLCAYFLFNQKMKIDHCSEEELLKWLVSKNDKIPSELRGVYAWFCSMTESEMCFSKDPYGQFLYGDNSLFGIENKKKVIKAIGLYANQVKPYFMRFGDAYRKEGFYEPALDSFLIDEYRRGLENRNNYLLFLGLVMTSATSPTPTILEFSKEVVAKADLEYHFKEMFIGYLENDSTYLLEILQNLIDGKIIDSDDVFYDRILSILYPEVIKPVEIISYLKKYKKHDCYRSQYSFLYKKTISLEDLNVLVDLIFSDEKLIFNDNRDLLDAIEALVGTFLFDLVKTKKPEIVLQKICSLAQKNFNLTQRAWYSKIKDIQSVDENIKIQLYLNYLLNTTPNNFKENNDVFGNRKYYLQSFVSEILPKDCMFIWEKILEADRTDDFKLGILFEMYQRLRSNVKTTDSAEAQVSEFAMQYGLLDQFKKGITYTPSPEIAEMMRKNEEKALERKRKVKEMVDTNRETLRTMPQEKKDNLWQLLINCAEFYLISNETEVEARLGLCLENYHEMLQILKSKLFQNPRKRVYYEYTNIQSLVNDAPTAGRNVDCLYYAILCLNGPEDYEKIDDKEFLEYLYLISVQESHVANSEKAEFMNWFEEKRINDAVGIIQNFILKFFEKEFEVLKNLRAFYLKMASEYRGSERARYLEYLKSVVFFTETKLSKQEEIAEKLMHVFDFQLNVNLLNSFELTGDLAAKRDSLVKFVNRDSPINKTDVKNLIEIFGFRWHSFSLKTIINDYQYLFIKSMMFFFDSRESMAFHSGVQSNIDGAAFYVNNVMLKQLNGVDGKNLLNNLLEDCESEVWKPMLKTRIEEIDEILTDTLKTKRSIDEAKKIVLQKSEEPQVTMNNYFNGPVNNSPIVGSAHNSPVVVNVNQGLDFDKVLDLIAQIESNIDKAGFSDTQKTEILSDIQDIRAAVERKDNSIIRSALDHIKNICDGVVGSLIANGISHMISPILL